MKSIDALRLDRAAKHPDVILAVMVGAVVAMMILPLPPVVLDALLATNVALAALVLVSTLMSERTLALSAFPSLLLFTTLFRLSLNVSTTRMILSTGKGGQVVQAFGDFVVRGDIIVGLVMFLVITIVQFLVIGKGAERVAEVGARFTLDAMPGKQMSIDAALRSGSINEDEAQKKRDELGRESQFYGAMDGAMKFVKGDAIAGLIITALNLVAGLIIGATKHGLPISESLEVYAILTVGDGLVSQVPALLITLAAGVLTTRVESGASNDLGNTLKAQLVGNPKVLLVAAGFSTVLGLFPGFPFLPFAGIALILSVTAFRLHKEAVAIRTQTLEKAATFQAKLDEKVQQAKAQRAAADNVAPAVPPIGIDLDPKLSKVLGFTAGMADADTELLGVLIPQLRDAMYLESGIRFPGVRVRSNVLELGSHTFVVRIKDVPVLEETIDPKRAMAVEAPDRLTRFGVDVKPTLHPLAGTEVGLVPLDATDDLEAAGVATWSPAGIVALHLAGQLRQHARSFVGLQEVAEMVERLAKVYPALVKETIPKIVTLSQLTDVIRRLADEGVSIRDLKTILECLAEQGVHQMDGVLLTESVRSALSLQLSHNYAGMSGRLSVVLLDPELEEAVRTGITHVTGGSYVALEPELRRAFLMSVARTLQPVVETGVRPILLTHSEIRRYVRKLLEDDLPDVAVLSFSELPAQLTIQPLGRVSLDENALAAA